MKDFERKGDGYECTHYVATYYGTIFQKIPDCHSYMTMLMDTDGKKTESEEARKIRSKGRFFVEKHIIT